MEYLKKATCRLVLLLLFAGVFVNCSHNKNRQEENKLTRIDSSQLSYVLPFPEKEGSMSVEKALTNRRSHRSFQDKALSAAQLSQILWAAYGVTMPTPEYPFLRGGLRTAPSAGALYPFEIYAVVGKVIGIDAGVYKYIPAENKIIRTIDIDQREALCAAALNQTMIKEAPVTIFYSAIFSRMTKKYGERGRERYVCMDLGHSAQNIYLQAEAMHLGTCGVGAFVDEKVKEVLQLPEEEDPLYIMPVGYYFEKREF